MSPDHTSRKVAKKGDAFRLLTAIHYNRERIYILSVLTHADYDKGGWKDTL